MEAKKKMEKDQTGRDPMLQERNGRRKKDITYFRARTDAEQTKSYARACFSFSLAISIAALAVGDTAVEFNITKS
jgi:hypothetical protein